MWVSLVDFFYENAYYRENEFIRADLQGLAMMRKHNFVIGDISSLPSALDFKAAEATQVKGDRAADTSKAGAIGLWVEQCKENGPLEQLFFQQPIINANVLYP